MRPLRLVFVEFGCSSGLFQFSLQLGEAIAAEGHTVELITGREPELQPSVPGMTIHTLLPTWHPGAKRLESPMLRRLRRGIRAGQRVRAWRELVNYLAQRPPDLVQWSEFSYAADGWFVKRIAERFHNVVMVDIAHSPRLFSDRRASERLYKTGLLMEHTFRRAYSHMDAVVVLSEQARRTFREAWPDTLRVEVIPHGDAGVLLQDNQPKPDACPPRVLFFGHWTRPKGIELLLEAYALLRPRLPHAELVIAGAVSNEVNYRAIARRAAEIGGVDLRPTYVPAGEVAPLVGSARVVVLPYLAANQSGVVHLAHTFARPVIATAVGGLPEVIHHGTTGLLVPPNDPFELALALEHLLRNPDEATRLGQRGKERLAIEASWHEVADKLLCIYAQLLTAAHRHAIQT